jgi:hypothetical protein
MTDVRPLMHSDPVLDVTYPEVSPHPALNPIVHLLDQKKFGRAPKHIASYLDIPCQHFAVRKDGSKEWIRNLALNEVEDVPLVKAFEKRFSRSDDLPCASVKEYGPEHLARAQEDISDDELDIAWQAAVDQNFPDLS